MQIITLFYRNAGSRESTVGVVIAKRLGYKFVDTDILIQEIRRELSERYYC